MRKENIDSKTFNHQKYLSYISQLKKGIKMESCEIGMTDDHACLGKQFAKPNEEFNFHSQRHVENEEYITNTMVRLKEDLFLSNFVDQNESMGHEGSKLLDIGVNELLKKQKNREDAEEGYVTELGNCFNADKQELSNGTKFTIENGENFYEDDGYCLKLMKGWSKNQHEFRKRCRKLKYFQVESTETLITLEENIAQYQKNNEHAKLYLNEISDRITCLLQRLREIYGQCNFLKTQMNVINSTISEMEKYKEKIDEDYSQLERNLHGKTNSILQSLHKLHREIVESFKKYQQLDRDNKKLGDVQTELKYCYENFREEEKCILERYNLKSLDNWVLPVIRIPIPCGENVTLDVSEPSMPNQVDFRNNTEFKCSQNKLSEQIWEGGEIKSQQIFANKEKQRIEIIELKQKMTELQQEFQCYKEEQSKQLGSVETFDGLFIYNRNLLLLECDSLKAEIKTLKEERHFNMNEIRLTNRLAIQNYNENCFKSQLERPVTSQSIKQNPNNINLMLSSSSNEGEHCSTIENDILVQNEGFVCNLSETDNNNTNRGSEIDKNENKNENKCIDEEIQNIEDSCKEENVFFEKKRNKEYRNEVAEDDNSLKTSDEKNSLLLDHLANEPQSSHKHETQLLIENSMGSKFSSTAIKPPASETFGEQPELAIASTMNEYVGINTTKDDSFREKSIAGSHSEEGMFEMKFLLESNVNYFDETRDAESYSLISGDSSSLFEHMLFPTINQNEYSQQSISISPQQRINQHNEILITPAKIIESHTPCNNSSESLSGDQDIQKVNEQKYERSSNDTERIKNTQDNSQENIFNQFDANIECENKESQRSELAEQSCIETSEKTFQEVQEECFENLIKDYRVSDKGKLSAIRTEIIQVQQYSYKLDSYLEHDKSQSLERVSEVELFDEAGIIQALIKISEECCQEISVLNEKVDNLHKEAEWKDTITYVLIQLCLSEENFHRTGLFNELCTYKRDIQSNEASSISEDTFSIYKTEAVNLPEKGTGKSVNEIRSENEKLLYCNLQLKKELEDLHKQVNVLQQHVMLSFSPTVERDTNSSEEDTIENLKHNQYLENEVNTTFGDIFTLSHTETF